MFPFTNKIESNLVEIYKMTATGQLLKCEVIPIEKCEETSTKSEVCAVRHLLFLLVI